jgi:hypothetical protein
MHTAQAGEAEEAKVLAWRRALLTAVGFSLPLAVEVAGEPRFDVHELIELVERGCPPEIAVRVLAPLDAEDRAA